MKSIVYFSKSAGHQHSVVERPNHDHVSVSEAAMLDEVASRTTMSIVVTKEGPKVEEALASGSLGVLVLYTSGDLLTPGTDRQPPFSEDGLISLLDWVRSGGSVVGIHSATDTLRSSPLPSEYTRMIGGAFRKHDPRGPGTVTVTVPDHPIVARLPESFSFQEEEWYEHDQLSPDIQVLAEVLPATKIEPIPLIWVKSYGSGRVAYIGLGHMERTWKMPLFHGLIHDAIDWASKSSRALETRTSFASLGS